MRGSNAFVLVLMSACAFAQTITYHPTSEEFAGPFASWRNVKTDFGAAGNGTTDDRAAIQRALDSLRNVPANSWCVLYFPAGTYRITGTLRTTRVEHNDYLGADITGEDPATTVISWDGPADTTMLNLDEWYSKISRLTFDGKGRARTAIYRGDGFSTACEMSDLFLKGVGCGIRFGSSGGAGQAEHAILRCRFTGCTEAGIAVSNWNSLDLYVWYCLFEDCECGVLNYMGGYHVYESVFLRSKTADIRNNNLCTFAYMNNVSVGSKTFMDMVGHSWPSPMLIQGNHIYDFTGDFALRTGNAGSQVVVDNVFKTSDQSKRPLWLYAGDQVAIGNTFNRADPIDTAQAHAQGMRFRIVDNTIVGAGALQTPQTIALPATPAKRTRTVYDVNASAADHAAEIQARIDAAAQQAYGTRPVVHIRKGHYSISRTIIVPSGKDILICGDEASENGTSLSWSGSGTGPVFRFEGPSRATLRDVGISAPDAIVVEDCDQSGARVYGNQLIASGASDQPSGFCTAGIYVDGVERANVQLICGGFGRYLTGIHAKGGATLASGGTTGGQVVCLSGASSRGARMFDVSNGGRLVGHGYWYEADWAYTSAFIDLAGRSGALTIAAMPWAINTDGPFIDVNGFKGILAVLSNNIGQQIYKWSMSGDGSQAKILNMCNSYNMADTVIPWTSVWGDQTSPAARAAMFNCNHWGNATGRLTNVADKQVGAQPDDQFLRDCLAQLRAVRIDSLAELPAGVTDLSVIRVLVTGAGGNLVTLKAGSSTVRDAHRACESGGSRRAVDSRVIAPGALFRLPGSAGTMTLCDLRGRVMWSGNPGEPRAADAAGDAIRSSRGMMVVGAVR